MLVYWKVDQNRSRDWDKTLPHAGAATVVLSDVICCQGEKNIYIYMVSGNQTWQWNFTYKRKF